MQNQNEIRRINHFIDFASPIVVTHVKMLLQAIGAEIQEQGHGLEMAFLIKSGKKELKFFLQNLFLEIATVDRDESPMRFDEMLHDFDYFLSKMTRLAQSKLRILFRLLAEDDVDKAIESIGQDAKLYERIRIWRFDKHKQKEVR
jgi:hypothetical protein